MRRLTHSFLWLIIAATLSTMSVSCHEEKPEEVAGRAAKIYYDYLLEGKYEAYVDGFYQPERIPQGYRDQLITNAKMFVGQQQKEHQGIASVQLQRATVSSDGRTANAFLLFCYGDSTKEEVVVPMVAIEGNWMMK